MYGKFSAYTTALVSFSCVSAKVLQICNYNLKVPYDIVQVTETPEIASKAKMGEIQTHLNNIYSNSESKPFTAYNLL